MRNERGIIRSGRRDNRIRTGYIALCCLLLSSWAQAGVPVISNQRVTDVTTRSFSVFLTVSEASTTLLSLFAADCTAPASYSSITRQQNQLSGNVRVTVDGLDPATGYCYQLNVTSAADSQMTTTVPETLTTATAIERTVVSGTDIVPVGNDIIKIPEIHLPGGENRDAIISTVELLNGTAASPLSRLLSIDQNKDYFNFNNLFTQSTGKTLHLTGGELVKIVEQHGNSGCRIERFRTMPTASGGTAPRRFVQSNTSDIDASGGVNILDALRLAGGKGTNITGNCFNSDLDLNGDGVIDASDLAIIKGGFNGI